MKKIFAFICIFCGLILADENLAQTSTQISTTKHKKVAVVGGLWPLPALISLWVKDADLIYIPSPSHVAFENSLFSEFDPQTMQIPFGDSDNIEEILALKADVYLCHKARSKVCEQLENSGVKTIQISTNIDKYSSFEVLKHWLNSLQSEFDIKAKDDALLDDIAKIRDEIAQKTANAPRPRAMILHKILPNNEYVVGVFSEYLLSNSGASNVVGYVEGTKKINFEEILRLNPQIIYISNFTPQMPEFLLKKPEFSGVEAVKNGKVYKMPLASYRSHAPNLELGVILKFFAKHNHPEIFADIDLAQEYKAHFKKYYGISLSDEQAQKILNPSSKAGEI